jgi:hypothetical protein
MKIRTSYEEFLRVRETSVEDLYYVLMYKKMPQPVFVVNAEEYIEKLNSYYIDLFREFCISSKIKIDNYPTQTKNANFNKNKTSWGKVLLGGVVASFIAPNIGLMVAAGALTNYIDKKIITKDKLIEITKSQILSIKNSCYEALDVIENDLIKKAEIEKLESYRKTVPDFQDRLSFIELLKNKYGFDGFHHYTDFTNFLKIYRDKALFSRVKANNRMAIDSANSNIIHKTQEEVKNNVRFFFKGKTPTLKNNEGIHINNELPHMPIPVLLLFSQELVFSSNISILDGGGGKRQINSTSDFSKAKKYDWPTIFSRGPIKENENKDYVKNARNAEFHIKDQVSLKYLKNIVFRSYSDQKMAEHFLGESNLYRVDKDKFINENNYLKEYNVDESNKPEIKLDFIFNGYNYFSYNHNLKILIDSVFYDINLSNDSCENNFFSVNVNNQMTIKKVLIKYKENYKPIKIFYYMNGHLSAIWRDNND